MSEVEFKVGDKVRLTGEHWAVGLKGTVQTVAGYSPTGSPFFQDDGREWYICSGYEAELLKRPRTLAEKRQADFEVLEKASRPWREAPDYYKFPNGVQTTDISMHLNSNGGQAVGYISRSTRIDGKNKETDPRESLQKAIDLLKMELYRLDQALGGSDES